VTPAMVPGIDQKHPLLSTRTPDVSPSAARAMAAPNAGTVLNKEATHIQVDTISISDQSRQAGVVVKNEGTLSLEAQREKAKKEEASKANTLGKSDGVMSKVQFVYDQKGTLSVRYMDSANRLIYQVPSELMLRLKEAASQSDSSVNTKA